MRVITSYLLYTRKQKKIERKWKKSLQPLKWFENIFNATTECWCNLSKLLAPQARQKPIFIKSSKDEHWTLNTKHTHLRNFIRNFMDFHTLMTLVLQLLPVVSSNAVDAIGGTVKCVPALTIHNAHPHFTNPFRCFHLRCIDINFISTICDFVHECTLHTEHMKWILFFCSTLTCWCGLKMRNSLRTGN